MSADLNEPGLKAVVKPILSACNLFLKQTIQAKENNSVNIFPLQFHFELIN